MENGLLGGEIVGQTWVKKPYDSMERFTVPLFRNPLTPNDCSCPGAAKIFSTRTR
jgi:hypothetical protein